MLEGSNKKQHAVKVGMVGDILHQLRGPWKQESSLIKITAKPSFLDQLHMSLQREILEETPLPTYTAFIAPGDLKSYFTKNSKARPKLSTICT